MDNKQVLNYLSSMYTPESQDEHIEDVGEEIRMDDGQFVLAETTSLIEKEPIKVDVTLVQEYMDWLNSDSIEILTFNEWVFLEKKRWEGKKRRFEGTFKKFMLYGLAAFVTLPIGGIIGPLLVFLYRHHTDDCVKSCGTNIPCFNNCYYLAAQKVVDKIKKELSSIDKIEKEGKRKRTEKTLKKELVKWEKRRDDYKKRVDSAKFKGTN